MGGLIAVMDGTPENLLTAKKAFWKRRESNLSGIVVLVHREALPNSIMVVVSITCLVNPATRLLPLGEGGRVHIFAPIMVVVVSRTACHVYGI